MPLPILVMLMLLPFASASYAAEGRGYLEGQAGMFLPIKSHVAGPSLGQGERLTYDAGFVLAALGGYEFGNGLRAEGELNFRHLATDRLSTDAGRIDVKGDVTTYGFMANLYYDFRNRTVVTPYVGGGIGLIVARFGKGTSAGTVLWSNDEDLNVAYQGIGGFTLRLSDSTSLDFAYHHYAVPRLHFKTLSAEFRGPNLSLGLRRWF